MSRLQKTIFLCIAFLLCGVAIASGEVSEDYAAGKAAGSAFALLVWAWAAIKSVALARRKTTSSLCVISLSLVALGWFLPTLVNFVSVPGKSLPLVAATILGASLILAGVVLAIVGLAQYKNNPKHVQGRRQAVTALVLAAIFFSLFGSGVYSNYAAKHDAPSHQAVLHKKQYSFDELNFNFETPETAYAEIEPGSINESASIVIRRLRPQIYFMIIAEAMGPGILDLKALSEIVLTNMQLAASKTGIAVTGPHKLKNMDGTRITIDATVSGKEFTFEYWIYEHNGYVFQLVAWSKSKNTDTLAHEFETLLAGFELQHMDRIANTETGEPFGRFESEIGVSIDLTGSLWTQWQDLAESYHMASVGGELGVQSLFQLTPFCYGDSRPHDDAIKSALLRQFDVAYPAKGMVLDDHHAFGNTFGEFISFDWDVDGDPYEARYAFKIKERCAYLLAFWTTFGQEKADEISSQLLKHIIFEKNFSGPPPGQHPTATAELFNGTGLHYFSGENYPLALKFFKQAQLTDPQDPDYVTNAFDAFANLREYRNAIEFLESNRASLTLNPEAHSWIAWFYEKEGQTEKSIEAYEISFSQGYRNDEDMGRYVDLLLDKDQLKTAESVLTDYAKEKDSVQILRKMAAIKRQQKKFDLALSILDRAQKGRPLETGLVFERIYVHRDKGEEAQVIELANELIDQGHASAGAYYQKGVAEYNLAWYVQAKDSFEHALKMAPGNENVVDYLAIVSGMLGQGDSTQISTLIEAVAIPQSDHKATEHTEIPVGFDSYYLKKAAAYHFELGKPLRETRFKKIKILSQQGVERFSTLTVDFDPYRESAYVNSLLVKNAAGEIVLRGNRDNYYVTDSDGEYADTKKTIHIPVANLSPGHIIELTHTTQQLSAARIFPYTHIYHSSARPVSQSIIFVSGDVGALEFSSTASDGPTRTEKSLMWQHLNPQIYHKEPMAVSPSNYLPSVTINQGAQDWQTLGQNYLDSIQEKMQISAPVKELAVMLTQGIDVRVERIAAIAKYIQDNITYKAIEFGVRGRIPNLAAETLQARYGDCKDHAVLFKALLQAAGIETRLTLVSLTSDVQPDMPSLDQFDHMVVYLPEMNGGYYIDTTDKAMYLMGTTPSGLADSFGLILQPKQSTLRKLPPYTATANRLSSDRKIDIATDGQAVVYESLTIGGYLGGNFRSYLRDIEPGKRLDWAGEFLSELNRKVELNSLKILNLENVNLDLILEMKYQISNDLLEDGTILFDDLSLWEYYFLLPGKVRERKTDFKISYPLKFASQVTIKTPPGYSFQTSELTKNGREDSFGSFSLDWDTLGDRTVKRFKFSQPAAIFAYDRYRQYQDFTRLAADSISRTLRVEPAQDENRTKHQGPNRKL